MQPFLALLLATAEASCAFGALDSCAIAPQSCQLWIFDCENHAKIKVDFAVTGGTVQAYVLPGGLGSCGGDTVFGLCEYPTSVNWCLETYLIATEGRCTLALLNANTLAAVTVDGKFTIVPPDTSGISSFESTSVLVVALVVVCGFCIIASVCVVLNLHRRCGLRSPTAPHYVRQTDWPSEVELNLTGPSTSALGCATV